MDTKPLISAEELILTDSTTMYIKEEPVDVKIENIYSYDEVFDPITPEFLSQVIIKQENTAQVVNDLNTDSIEPYKCLMCQTLFIKKPTLRAHISRHSKSLKYKIRSKSHRQVYLTSPKRINNINKPYTCDICNKQYSQLLTLNSHKRVHITGKPMCHICHKLFWNKTALVRHTIIHKLVRPYECDICHKWFADQTTFIRHKYVHTGERPYRCDVCHKGFSHPSSLRTHMRMHTGKRPFNCDICHKSFVQKCDLIRHLRIHTGEKPYECDICHMRFADSSTMHTHKKRIHGDISKKVIHEELKREQPCLFSGARGEVCTFEPLLEAGSVGDGGELVVAIATLSKVIVITIKPRLRVLFSQALPRCATALPLLAWQLVLVGKTWQPVLCWARGTELNYTRLVRTCGNSNAKTNKLALIPLRQVQQLPYTLTALHWLGARHLALLDTSEHLRLIDVRTQRELECIDVTGAGLVYASAHFKALAVGGSVSQAFALAAEHACYNSVCARGEQLLVLGTRALHLVKLRTWHERLVYLSKRGCWTEALRIAAAQGADSKVTAAGADNLLSRYVDMLQAQSTVDWDALSAAVGCCIKLNKADLLCDQLWDAIAGDRPNREWYLGLLADYICQGAISYLSPAIAQALISYLDNSITNNTTQLNNSVEDADEQRDREHTLQRVLLTLDLTCLDLDQVLRLCKARGLYDAWIHVTTKTIGDYAGPLVEFLGELTPSNHKLGNTLLVYVSACLAGYGHPTGVIPPADRTRAKYDIVRCLQTLHSRGAPDREPSYPYLRALLAYNIRECLNVVRLAFGDGELFSGEMGAMERVRMMEICMVVVQAPQFDDSQITALACFISRLITTNQLKLNQIMLDGVIKALTNVTARQPLSKRDHHDREQAWLDLLIANKLQHIPKGQLLNGALESKCFKVAEYLYELSADYDQIVNCRLLDAGAHNEGDSSAVFAYIRQHVHTHLRRVRAQFQRHFRQLLRANGKATVDLLLEHYVDELDVFCALVEGDEEAQFVLLRGLVYNYDKVSSELSEQYLELACKRNDADVDNFVHMRMCDVNHALAITRRYRKDRATATLLEANGEYKAALTILLNMDLIHEAQSLCIRGTDQLDMATTQTLWLELLQHCKSSDKVTLRDLVHNAAPYIPAEQLLELVAGAQVGDVRALLQGVFHDYHRDIQMLRITLGILGNDLHHNLARCLYASTRAIPVTRLNCDMCRKPFDHPAANSSQQVTVFGCGHGYHTACCQTSLSASSAAIDDSSNDSGHCSGSASSLLHVSNSVGYCVQCTVRTRELVESGGCSVGVGTTVVLAGQQLLGAVRPDLEGHF